MKANKIKEKDPLPNTIMAFYFHDRARRTIDVGQDYSKAHRVVRQPSS